MPPITASPPWSLATSCLVIAVRLSTLTWGCRIGAGLARGPVFFWVAICLALERLAAGEQRRKDEGDRRLRRNRLLDRAADHETQRRLIGERVMGHGDRIE